MSKVEFSVLSYYPSFITTDSITVGVLFNVPGNNKREFKHISNWRRLLSFDDELDKEFVETLFDGIQYQIQDNLFTNGKFVIRNFTRFYVNEFRFDDVISTEVDNIDEFIDETHKVYMRLDFDKSKRLKKNEEIKYLKYVLLDNQIEHSTEKVTGEYNESIKFDFVLDNYGIKLFNINESNVGHLMNHIKAWAYNAEELKDKYKIIITYTSNEDVKNISGFDSIRSIINESAVYKFMQFDDCINFLTSTKK